MYVVSRDQKENLFASYKWQPSIGRWLRGFCASSFPCQYAEHAHKEGSSIPPPAEYLAKWLPKWSHRNYCGPNVIPPSLRLSLSVARLCPCCPVAPPAFLPLPHLFIVCLLTLSCYSFAVVFTVCILDDQLGLPNIFKRDIINKYFFNSKFYHQGTLPESLPV